MSRNEKVKKFAEKQMDSVWHNQSRFKYIGMVQFPFKGYTIVNPWMDERTQKPVNPFHYYGVKSTKRFIRKALKKIAKEEAS